MTAPVLEEAVLSLLGEMGAPSSPLVDSLTMRPLSPQAGALTAAAVDGGQSVIANIGSCGVVAVRAGYTRRSPPDAYADRTTFDAIHVVTKRRLALQWGDWIRPYTWGLDIDPPVATGAQWIRAWCEGERCVAEYDAARRALRDLHPGDLLLVDGCLEDEAANLPLQEPLRQAARRDGVHLVGVTKDTSRSLGGTLPFTLELEEMALRRALPSRFTVDVTDALGVPSGFRIFGARFDSRAPVYRVDVAAADGTSEEAVLGAVAGLCNDVAYPGYPYPLARIHHLVHYADRDAGDLRRRLEALVAERRGSGLSMRLFGRGRDVLVLGE